MSEDSDVWYSVSNLNLKEVKHYQLSELVNKDKCCIRCMSDNCNIEYEHGNVFPKQITYFLKNPLRINTIKKSIEESKLNFDNFMPRYNLCYFIYSHGNCRNCNEGRFKYIDVDGYKIKLCYADLKNIKSKVPVGFHIDIKFSITNNKININEVLPYEINNQELIEDNYEKKEINTIEDTDLPIGTVVPNKNILDYSKIKKNNTDNLNKNINGKQNYSNQNSKNNHQLIIENEKLKNRINYLEEKLEYLCKEIDNEKDKIYDMHKTIEYVNNRVVTQFFNTNIREYLESI